MSATREPLSVATQPPCALHFADVHVLLAEEAPAVADTELPVVPLAREQLAVEAAGHEPVALVRARVVERAVERFGQAREVLLNEPSTAGVIGAELDRRVA